MDDLLAAAQSMEGSETVTPAPPRPKLRLENISFVADCDWNLENMDLDFPEGRCTAILGPSGSGKSLILKLAAGIYVPEGGKIFYEDQDISLMSEGENLEFRKKTGFVFQDSALWANKSVYQNIELPLRFHYPHLKDQEVQAKVRGLLKTLNYDEPETNRPHQISSGDQKRISLARVLVVDPELLFLDDPTASVDNDGVEKMVSLLKELKEQGKTLILVTQTPEIAALLADELVIVDQGRILTSGPFDQVTRSTDARVMAILKGVLSRVSTYSEDILNLLGGN